jgi:hypothetical protein
MVIGFEQPEKSGCGGNGIGGGRWVLERRAAEQHQE